jgi:hypothetical protein
MWYNSSRPMILKRLRSVLYPAEKLRCSGRNKEPKFKDQDFAYDLTSDSSVISSGRGFILPLENKF